MTGKLPDSHNSENMHHFLHRNLYHLIIFYPKEYRYLLTRLDYIESI